MQVAFQKCAPSCGEGPDVDRDPKGGAVLRASSSACKFTPLPDCLTLAIFDCYQLVFEYQDGTLASTEIHHRPLIYLSDAFDRSHHSRADHVFCHCHGRDENDHPFASHVADLDSVTFEVRVPSLFPYSVASHLCRKPFDSFDSIDGPRLRGNDSSSPGWKYHQSHLCAFVWNSLSRATYSIALRRSGRSPRESGDHRSRLLAF